MSTQNSGMQDFQRRRTQRLLLITLLFAIAGFTYLAWWWWHGRFWVSTHDAYVTGNLVPVKAQTRGTAADIFVDDTQFVRQGALMVRLNGLQAKLALERAEANLAESVRHVQNLFSQVENLRQSIAMQKADIIRVEHDLARARSVLDEGAVSAQEVEHAEDQIRIFKAKLGMYQAQLQGAESQVGGTSIANNPLVMQSANALKQAYLDYVRREIRAPVSGFVAKRSINPGDQVQAGALLMSIVPLNYLWVEANIKETAMGQVHPGQSAQLSVDYYGSRMIFHGRVLGLNPGTGGVFGLLPPENATGNYIHIVERVPVRISLDPKELAAHPLRPGLSVIARVQVGQAGGPVLQSLTQTPLALYRTPIYANQLAGAQHLIDRIIRDNLLSGQKANMAGHQRPDALH